MKNYSISKLDRRYTGSDLFIYFVNFTNSVQGQIDFVEQRKWAWATFGPSSELEYINYDISDGNMPTWAWKRPVEWTAPRLYLRGDLELSMHQLKWVV